VAQDSQNISADVAIVWAYYSVVSVQTIQFISTILSENSKY